MVKRFDSYPRALAALASELRAKKFDPFGYKIVLTPDRYTQSVESALFSGGGAIDTEVLTLSRLAGRIAPQAKPLSREGGVMITARAVSAVKSELVYYARAAAYSDFAREAFETLQQIASSDVDVNSLTGSGATAAKLHDLALIKAEYDKIKAERCDGTDRITCLINALPFSAFVKNADVYAVGFSDTSRLNARALDEIGKVARSFTVYDADPPENRRMSARVISASDRISEYKYIASDILDYIDSAVRAGETSGKYSDIAVVCTSPKALSRIFSEYGIPVYKDETKQLYRTKPLAATELVYELVSVLNSRGAIDCEALVSLAKNPFSGCDGEDAEVLQNGVAERGLRFVPEAYDFKKTGGEKSVARVLELCRRFGSKRVFADAVEELTEYGEFETIQRGMGARTDAVTPVLALTELLSRYGSGDFDTDAKAFFAAARAVNVNSLPRERDCVTVTVPQALRLTACKRLYVADFNEGVLPQVVSGGGLLSDDELTGFGGAVEPTVLQINRRNRAELKAVVNNAEHVVFAYSAAGGAKPASVMHDLAENLQTIDVTECVETLKYSSDSRFISFFAPTRASARELAARSLTSYTAALSEAAGETERTAAEFDGRITPFEKNTVSVSELSHWFKCPYMRFLKDSVGLNERRRGLSAPDFGIIVHDFMQKFIDKGDYDCSRDAVEKLVDASLADKNIELSESERARMVSDAADYASVNKDIVFAGSYRPVETEMKFSGKMSFGTDENNRADFVGCIDRIDACGGSARIVDYKTGATEFDVKSCLNGCDMQLPLYAAAVADEYDVTGMFYVKLNKKYETEEKRAMSGCMVKDVDIAREYDGSLMPGGSKSVIIPAKLKTDKNGDTVFDRENAALMDENDFFALIDKCRANADVAVKEMSEGWIKRSPSEDMCDRCAFRGICLDSVSPRSADTESDD